MVWECLIIPARPLQKEGKSERTKGRSNFLESRALPSPNPKILCSPHHSRAVSRSTNSNLKHELQQSACHWALNYARDLFTLKPVPRAPRRWLGIWGIRGAKGFFLPSQKPRRKQGEMNPGLRPTLGNSLLHTPPISFILVNWQLPSSFLLNVLLLLIYQIKSTHKRAQDIHFKRPNLWVCMAHLLKILILDPWTTELWTTWVHKG